jgi:uncharacterized OB-fold protein
MARLGFAKFGYISYLTQTRVSEFTKFLAEGKLFGTKCVQCRNIEFPPRANCSRCLSDKWEWIQLSGDCRLLTFTKVEAAPAAFQDQAPYILGLAEFSEGPKVLAWIDRAIPETEVKAGLRLKLNPTTLKNGQLSYVLTTPS